MNKKMNYLAIFPILGSFVLLFWLFIKAIKDQINKKIFMTFFFSIGLFSVLVMLVVVLCINFIYSLTGTNDFLSNYGPMIAYIITGYLMNLFTFILINKEWDKLEKH